MSTNLTDQAIQTLKACPEALANAKVVGAWVWVSFDTKPSDEVRAFLKSHGYRFNGKRGAWQNPCGVHSKNAPYDPRQKYGAVPASELIAPDGEDF